MHVKTCVHSTWTNKDINITNAISLRCMCTHDGIFSSPSIILQISITMLYKTKTHSHVWNTYNTCMYIVSVCKFCAHHIYIFTKLCLQIIFYSHLFLTKLCSSNYIFIPIYFIKIHILIVSIYIFFYIITYAL